MRKRRSERTVEGSGKSLGDARRGVGGVALPIVGISCLLALAFVGCKQADGLVELEDVLEKNRLHYESAELSEASVAKRIKEIDEAYAEPRTWAKVSLSLETSLLSISPHNGYAALWRGARACAWLARHAATESDRERYAFLGIAWGKEAVKRDSTQANSFYYLALNEGILLELRDYELQKYAREMKGNLLMADSIDPGVDYCGPKRALGRLLVEGAKHPAYSLGGFAAGLQYLEAAMADCPTFGDNYLALAEALIEGGDYERARALLNQMVDMPGPPDHATDHQHWLARASDLLNDLPGL